MSKVDIHPFLRTPYNYDRMAVTNRLAFKSDKPSMAKQSFKDDSDPNVIMRKFTQTRDPALLNVRNSDYGDFTGVGDFHTALNNVMKAEESFMSLPAAVRTRFANDPGQLLDFVNDSKNRDEAEKLGLLPPRSASEGARPSQSAVATKEAKPEVQPQASSSSSKKPIRDRLKAILDEHEGGSGEA